MTTHIALFLVLVIGIAVTIVIVSKRNDKKLKVKNQLRDNAYIEARLLEISVAELLKHSNHLFLAHRIAGRIKELMLYGASPAAMLNLYNKLDITQEIENPQNDKDRFLQMIQKELYEAIDNLDAERWMRTSRQNNQTYWHELQGTIISKVRHNGFVMDLF